MSRKLSAQLDVMGFDPFLPDEQLQISQIMGIQSEAADRIQASELAMRPMVACDFDLFSEDVPRWLLVRTLVLMLTTPNIDWLVPTHHADVCADMLEDAYETMEATGVELPETPLANVWLGAIVTCQEDVDRCVPEMLKIEAAALFVHAVEHCTAIDLSRLPNSCGLGVGLENVDALRRFEWEVLDAGLVESAAIDRGVDWVLVTSPAHDRALPGRGWVRDLRQSAIRAGAAFRAMDAERVLPSESCSDEELHTLR